MPGAGRDNTLPDAVLRPAGHPCHAQSSLVHSRSVPMPKTTSPRQAHAFAATRKTFKTASGREGTFYSLPALARAYPNVKRLPVSIRIVLESVLRNCDGKKVTRRACAQLANWQPKRSAHRGNPLRRGAHRAAGLHRRAAAGRPGGDAQRRRAPGQGPEDHRAAGAGGPGGGPLGAGGSLRHRGRARPATWRWSSSATGSATSS